MRNPLRTLSLLLLILALAGMGTLVFFDGLNHLALTSIHQQMGALSFILIGTSYISLQLSSRRRWAEKLKGIMLGVGFLLWGCEQFIQPSVLVTIMDSLVVTIFVVDLGLIIMGRLRRKDDEPT
jgi:peptidoglycan/LPS O-acetylase OafA/YrhL